MATKRPKRGPPRRRARKPSRALVRRAPAQVLPPATNGEHKIAPDGSIDLGALGLVEVKLTKREEQNLAEPVQAADVLIKPTGQVYLSHPVYTRWFNRAFGRLGWAIVPVGKPQLSGNSVVCPYVLFIHGKPVRFAWGEQEYFEKNRDQSYGDALESTVASAMRRLAKRLGVSLELWDRRWTNRFLAEHGQRVKVEVEKDGKPGVSYRWRRKDDPPLWGEIQADERRTRTYVPEPSIEETARDGYDRRGQAGHHGKLDSPITQPQRQRLYVIAKHAGRPETEVKMWLKLRYGIDSSRQITRRDYDAICRAIEAPGSLPMPREPGEDG